MAGVELAECPMGFPLIMKGQAGNPARWTGCRQSWDLVKCQVRLIINRKPACLVNCLRQLIIRTSVGHNSVLIGAVPMTDRHWKYLIGYVVVQAVLAGLALLAHEAGVI